MGSGAETARLKEEQLLKEEEEKEDINLQFLMKKDCRNNKIIILNA
jgi:hypothetical protein